MDRREKVDKLYQEYLKEKLDLVFNGENGDIFPINIGYQYPEKKRPKIIKNFGHKKILERYMHGGKFSVFPCKFVTDFIDGWAVIVRYVSLYNSHEHTFVNTSGDLLFKSWFDYLEPFSDDIAVCGIKQDKKITYNFVDKEGYLLLEEQLDEKPHSFKEGFALIFYSNGKCNYINTEGEKLLKEDIAKGYDFCNGCAKISYDGNEYTFIDTKGNAVLPIGMYKNDYLEQTPNFYILDGKIIPKKSDLGGCKVRKELLGYHCEFFGSNFKMKYQPLKRYGLRYYLCFNKRNVYLYDRFGNKYISLGTLYNVEFDDNFIVDRKNNQVYFVYNDKILNITEYYNKNLAEKSEVRVSMGVKDIFSQDEFSFMNLTKIDALMNEEAKKDAEIKLAQEKQRQIDALKKKNELAKKREKESQNSKKEALRQLKEILKVLSNTSETGKTSRLLFSDIFIEKGTYKIINPEMLELLKHIELGYINFDNVKVDGIDFRGCNIDMQHRFNPQKVYGKSLRNCNFEGIHLGLIPINFSGVDIRGCRFGSDDDYMTRDIMPESFKDAIYDETTTYNGQPLTEIFAEEKKK